MQTGPFAWLFFCIKMAGAERGQKIFARNRPRLLHFQYSLFFQHADPLQYCRMVIAKYFDEKRRIDFA